jgi:hypothetical protein
MENKLGQEPAFAKETLPIYGQIGMSKRFYAACAAMQGILANNRFLTTEQLIRASYECTDELLKQENQ